MRRRHRRAQTDTDKKPWVRLCGSVSCLWLLFRPERWQNTGVRLTIQLRRRLTRAGLMLSSLLGLAWLLAGCCTCVYAWLQVEIGCYDGCFFYRHCSPSLSAHGWRAEIHQPRWLMRPQECELDFDGSTMSGHIYSCDLPLWIPFVMVAVPSAWLWWRGRRRFAAGCCQHCGYDLTGNASGICPECGTACPAMGPQDRFVWDHNSP